MVERGGEQFDIVGCGGKLQVSVVQNTEICEYFSIGKQFESIT